MKEQTTNVFTISTPSQMLNAIEFVHYYNLKDASNVVIITCNSDKFIEQIKKIGCVFSFKYHILFSPKFSGINPRLYNRMPLKLFRLYFSKKRINKLLKEISVDRLILGNYSNFISQYCTQRIITNTYVLDDGTGTILVAQRREGELLKNTPIFDFNYKKKALWVVKLLMGFYDYKIPTKLIFFSSYKLKVIGQDECVYNAYDYLKDSYQNQEIDHTLEYFIGSPISEVGYVTQKDEIQLILDYAKQLTSTKLVYIPHRLDSIDKLNELKKSFEITTFNLPIEFALSQRNKLPIKVGGFFTSALPNLVKLMPKDILFFAVKIPRQSFLTENMENRATQVYNTYKTIDRIKIN